ncbi:MAG: hypothetical protein GX625_10725 [Clostridiaceae bacterium]|nr:hypothetical protein [Clostridiaceae bacterium]
MAPENNQKRILASWPASPNCKGNMMGEPAYVLIAHSSDPNKGRGEEYNVEVYISGIGDVDELPGEPGYAAAKLYVSIPAYLPETFKREPNWVRLSVKSKYTEYTEIKLLNDFKGILREGSHTSAFDCTVPLYLFHRKLLDNNPNNLGVEGERMVWDKQWWKDTNYYYAPFSFSFTVANNAPSGDHNIYLHLVYRDCLRWYSNNITLKIHIKQWYEEDYIHFLAILAALASIVSAFYALYNI